MKSATLVALLGALSVLPAQAAAAVSAGGRCAADTIPGTLDREFGLDGRRSRAIGADNNFRPTLLLDDDDRVQIAAGGNFVRVRPGSPFPVNESDPALFQFTVAGLDDSSFPAGGTGNGLADADSLDGRDFVGGYADAVRQPDGKRVLTARLGIQGGFANVDSAVLRLNPDGSRDSTFGSDGGVTLPKPLPDTEVGSLVGLAVQADGRIVGIGSITRTGGQSIGYFLARFNVDGTLDDGSAGDSTPGDSFGTADADGVDGVVLNRSEAAFALSSTGYRVRVQGSRIVVIDTTDAVNEVRLFGHTADGRLDAGFGSGGVVRDIRGDGFCIRPELLVQPDQKLLFTAECVIGRLNPDGSPDASFGGDGFVFRDADNTRELTSGLVRTATKWLALQPDGKFLTGGSTSDGLTEIARFHADGLPDTGFGDDRIQIPLAGSLIFGGLAVDRLGAVVVGNLDNRTSSATSIELARLCGGLSVDTRPDPFSFDDRVDVPLSTEQRSNVYTVSGLADTVPALIRVENGEYSAGCAGEGAPLFETAMEKVYNGMRICVRHTSAATPGTAVTTTLILSAGPDEFREDFTTVTAGGAPVNGLPVAADDSASTEAGRAVLIDVLGNDRDPDGDPLTIVSIDTPANGTAELLDGRIRYTPAAGFTGTDRFVYRISDGRDGPRETLRGGPVASRVSSAVDGDSRAATVTITVSAVPPPVDPVDPVDPGNVSGNARRGGGAFGGALLGGFSLLALLRTRRRRLLALAGLLLSIAAQADEAPQRGYLGLTAGRVHSGEAGDGNRALANGGHSGSARIDTRDGSFGVYGGRPLLPWLALEAGYDKLGRYGATFSGTSTAPAQFARDLLAAMPAGGDAYFLRLRLNQAIGADWQAFARIGGAYIHSESRITINGTSYRGNDDLGALHAGFGLRRTLDQRWALIGDTGVYWPARGQRALRFGAALECRF
ncbi:MAG: Ig-like domain-containing protein [Gammaproteobacteria bacterium]|nr:Ig-like domain-containing protein [Gammaproteobacteria bacterium]